MPNHSKGGRWGKKNTAEMRGLKEQKKKKKKCYDTTKRDLEKQTNINYIFRTISNGILYFSRTTTVILPKIDMNGFM